MHFWISVTSKDHVTASLAGGFMQAPGEKAGPLHQLEQGDIVFFYSPGTLFRRGEVLQAFTGAARVTSEAPQQVAVAVEVAEVDAHALEGVLADHLGARAGEAPLPLQRGEADVAGGRAVVEQAIGAEVIGEVQLRQQVAIEVGRTERERPAAAHVGGQRLVVQRDAVVRDRSLFAADRAKDAKRFLRRLARLQDWLGVQNDLATERHHADAAILRLTSLVLLASLQLTAPAETPAKLVPASSEVLFVTKQMGVPVEGRFKKFDAQVSLDPKKPESGSVAVSIDTGSAALGVPESDAELPKATWFNVAKFPQATFKSTSIKGLGNGKFEVAGKLDVKGTSRDVVVPALNAMGLTVPVMPDGAFYAWADCSAFHESSWDFCFDMMQRAHVALTPGRDFGPHAADRYLRLSFASSMDELQHALQRLARVLR